MPRIGSPNSHCKYLKSIAADVDANAAKDITQDQTTSQLSEAVGDVQPVFLIPSNDTIPATTEAWTYDVLIQLVDDGGDACEYINNDITVSIADTSTAGTASITDTTPAMTEGAVTVQISGDAAAWVAAETVTLTISNYTDAFGNTVTGGDFVLTVA